jgi:hypothetical protein
MSRSLRLRCIALLVCMAILIPARPARAESLHTAAVEIIVAIVAVTAVITTVIVIGIRHAPSIQGCLRESPDGLEMASTGDNQTYLLTGDTASLKAGERVKIQGKKKGKDAAGNRHFFVEKFKKDYGPCSAAAAP